MFRNLLEIKINLKAIILIPLFVFAVLFVLTSCVSDKSNTELSLNEKLKFDKLSYHNAIGRCFYDNDAMFFKDKNIQYIDTLKKFYSERSLQPVVIKSFEDATIVNSILEYLVRADEHGLDPALYHYNQIKKDFFDAINDTIDNPNRYDQLAKAEILLSDALLKYSYHIRYGVVNPKLLFGERYNIPLPDSASRNLFEPLLQENISEYLKKIQPASERYTKLQEALKHYKNYLGMNWPVITISSNKIEPGSSEPSLNLIAERLIVLGLLDTTNYKISNPIFYDSVFVDAVKKFQRLNGLNDDGIIGKGTIDRLNITPEQYVNTIKINLERFRWNDYTNTPQYLLVNIPDFKVYAIENKKEVFNIKVCTGLRRPANFDARYAVYQKTRKLRDKPDDWETPCLYSEISYMVLNPTWTVPASIIREEIYREVKKDSTYLQRKNFKVYQQGTEVDLADITPQKLSASSIPFTVVQDPGAGNALGRIKFMFNNPFGVYLHDTPTRAPFNNSNRAVSHGCVRVEKPIMLAEFLLRDHSKWNIDFLKLEIGQRVDDRAIVAEYQSKRSALRRNSSFGKTTEIIIDRKMPLYIDYFTAWVDEEGNVNFREDVYRKDKILTDYLFPAKEV